MPFNKKHIQKEQWHTATKFSGKFTLEPFVANVKNQLPKRSYFVFNALSDVYSTINIDSLPHSSSAAHHIVSAMYVWFKDNQS